MSVTGETSCFNGLEIDGVESFIPGGIIYRLCKVCGSSIYFDLIPGPGGRFFTIALGCFVEPLFRTPSTEFAVGFRHRAVAPISGALDIPDPTGADAVAAWEASDHGAVTKRMTRRHDGRNVATHHGAKARPPPRPHETQGRFFGHGHRRDRPVAMGLIDRLRRRIDPPGGGAG